MTSLNASDFFDDPQEVALATAAAAGRTQAVDAAIDAGADPSAVGKDGMSPLIFALSAQNLDGVRRLAERGADPNHVPANGMSPMHIAAMMETSDFLRMLIGHSGDIELSGRRGKRPLMAAAEAGRTATGRVLIDAGADLDATDDDGDTAAITAAMFNQFEIVVLLLEAGADPMVRSRTGGNVPYLVQSRKVNPSMPAYEWQQKARALLEQKGIAFPVPSPAEERKAAESLQTPSSEIH
ncbi:MAG: ankyrin repeat domain-containing protein [Acidobacteriota bacterium]